MDTEASSEVVNQEKLLKLQRLSESVRMGGKGSVRRKKKLVAPRSVVTDDKKLQATIKKSNVTSIPQVEEVNIFKTDGTVISFTGPKLQANITANTYVVSGVPRQRKLTEVLNEKTMIPQLGVENINKWTSVGEQVRKMMDDGGHLRNDEVPDLVGDTDFETHATKKDREADDELSG